MKTQHNSHRFLHPVFGPSSIVTGGETKFQVVKFVFAIGNNP
jgi:hypothetical protein